MFFIALCKIQLYIIILAKVIKNDKCLKSYKKCALTTKLLLGKNIVEPAEPKHLQKPETCMQT